MPEDEAKLTSSELGMEETNGHETAILLVGPYHAPGQLGPVQIALEECFPVGIVHGSLLAVWRRPLPLVEQGDTGVVGVGNDLGDFSGVDTPHTGLTIQYGGVEGQEVIAVYLGQHGLVAVGLPELVPGLGDTLVFRDHGNVTTIEAIQPCLQIPPEKPN